MNCTATNAHAQQENTQFIQGILDKYEIQKRRANMHTYPNWSEYKILVICSLSQFNSESVSAYLTLDRYNAYDKFHMNCGPLFQ